MITFEKDMDTDRLLGAVKRVLKAHPSLFVHFEIRDNKVTAIRDEVMIPEITVTELSEEKLRRCIYSSAAPFRLDKC